MFGWIGIYSPLVIVLYLASMQMVYRFERRRLLEVLEQETQAVLRHEHVTLRRALVCYGIAAGAIVVAGSLLPSVADEPARTTGLAHSFVGTLLVSAATSMPALVVSTTAVRRGAVDMAVSNLLGSNLFNIAILGIDDVFYTRGPLLANVSEFHVLTSVLAMIMTCVAIVGLVYRAQKKALMGVGLDSLALLLLYLLGTYSLFILTRSGV